MDGCYVGGHIRPENRKEDRKDPVKKVWVKLDGNTEKRFAVNHDGSTEFTSTAPGGAPRRKRDLCVQFMTSTAIKRTLREN